MKLRLDNKDGGCEIEASGQSVKLSHDEILDLCRALAPLLEPVDASGVEMSAKP
jgi:hypothetical protein